METVKNVYDIRDLVQSDAHEFVQADKGWTYDTLAMTDAELDAQTDRAFFFELGWRLGDALNKITLSCSSCGTCNACIRRTDICKRKLDFDESDVTEVTTLMIEESVTSVEKTVKSFRKARLARLRGTEWTSTTIKTVGPYLRSFILPTNCRREGLKRLIEKTRDAGQIVANRHERFEEPTNVRETGVIADN